MTIAVFTAELPLLEEVTASLAAEGIDLCGIELNGRQGSQPSGADITKGILIVPKHGAGEPTARVRELLLKEKDLILCATQPDSKGSQLLKALGATKIITPRTWASEHVSERVLAQLILDGDIAPSACGKLHGATRAMRELYGEMEVIARLADPVLILGETGTGKELVAGEIHNLSKRGGRLLSVNCGELSLELAGSDLFGHKRGSFTGATEARRGLLAEAGEGTIFLDEIGELDLKAQAILLRVLEEKKVRRVGSNQTEEVRARIVLATNRDLELECEEGRFRTDLFERIRGFTLTLNPLRERRADIPLLVHHFLAEFGEENGQVPKLRDGALDCLFNYHWVGNVRELRSATRKASAFADSKGFVSDLHLLQATQRGRKRQQNGSLADAKYYVTFDPTRETLKEFTKRAEARYIEALLKITGGNKKEASRLAGMGLSQFYEKLKDDESRPRRPPSS
jgi:DNA-binding NtrC family response regulator